MHIWTGENGITRNYLGAADLSEALSFTVEYNKRGQVVGGTYQGRTINGAWMKDLLNIAAYIQDGELHVFGATKAEEALIREYVADLLPTTAEKDEAMTKDATPADATADTQIAAEDERVAEQVGAEHTGLELRCRREALGLSQNLTAKAFRVSQAAWSQWEAGKRRIPPFVVHGMDGLESALRAETHAQMDLMTGHMRCTQAKPIVFPQARGVPEDVDQEVIAETMARVAVGRAYAALWLEDGVSQEQLRVEADRVRPWRGVDTPR